MSPKPLFLGLTRLSDLCSEFQSPAWRERGWECSLLGMARCWITPLATRGSGHTKASAAALAASEQVKAPQVPHAAPPAGQGSVSPASYCSSPEPSQTTPKSCGVLAEQPVPVGPAEPGMSVRSVLG